MYGGLAVLGPPEKILQQIAGPVPVWLGGDQIQVDFQPGYIFNYWVKGHLGFRDPICPYTSVPILYENPTLTRKSPAQKAAAMLAATAEVYRSFRSVLRGSSQSR